MSNLLPVLQRAIPAMTMCSICPMPGSCCRGFHLNFTLGGFPLATWEQEANDRLEKYRALEDHGFVVIGAFRNRSWDGQQVDPMYGCTWLQDGRCSQYERRPYACHSFVPGQGGGLCVFDPEHRPVRVPTPTVPYAGIAVSHEAASVELAQAGSCAGTPGACGSSERPACEGVI